MCVKLPLEGMEVAPTQGLKEDAAAKDKLFGEDEVSPGLFCAYSS